LLKEKYTKGTKMSKITDLLKANSIKVVDNKVSAKDIPKIKKILNKDKLCIHQDIDYILSQYNIKVLAISYTSDGVWIQVDPEHLNLACKLVNDDDRWLVKDKRTEMFFVVPKR
jgi:hypothetical protein